jgi:signal transduction histidine kinase/CheY-like chemotaxis protein
LFKNASKGCIKLVMSRDRDLESVFFEISTELFAVCNLDGSIVRWSSAVEAHVAPEILATTRLRIQDGAGELSDGLQGLPLRYNVVWRGGDSVVVRFAVVNLTEDTEFHRQRMQTLGELAGGIAHDFNNLLAGILGHVTYLKNILPNRGEHCESIGAIADGARKASEMTGQILNFSRLGSNVDVRAVDLVDFVGRAVLLIKGALEVGQELVVSPPKDMNIFVSAAEGKLMQVLANLCMNARDALDGEGTITIRVGRFGEAEAYVSVEDTGCGINPNVLGRIFDPFFSTKGSSGTGLGLSTTAAIVREFSGRIEVESEVDLGTRVTIYLPFLSNQAAPSQKLVQEERPNVRGGGECIMVVDDDPAVLRVIAMSLEHLGYSVLTAAGGPEALDLYKNPTKTISLVLLDMLMPVMPGEQVFAALSELDPKVKVLVMSGYSSQVALDMILSSGGLGFIQKPFSIEELAENVAECLSLEL